MEKMFQLLQEGLKENFELDVKRELVNSILPVYKYKLLSRFLSKEQNLSEEIRVNCLPIFLDERTAFFSFVQDTCDQKTIKSILKIISKYCPNIKTVDLRNLRIAPENKQMFKSFLKRCKQLKSLRLVCDGSQGKDAIYQILFQEKFFWQDIDIQNGLLKIDYIDGLGLNGFECAKLLKVLPNLISLGIYIELGRILPYCINNKVIVKKLSNITEFGDYKTTTTSLERYSKFCQKAKKIRLCFPEKNALENLSKFPLLTEIKLETSNPDLLTELTILLERIGTQIRILDLNFPDRSELDPKIFRRLCPELLRLYINSEIIQF